MAGIRVARPLLSSLLAAALLAALPGTSRAQRWEEFTVDPVHSSVVFGIQHWGFSTFYGRFTDIAGSFRTLVGHPNRGRVEIRIRADSVDTGNEKRDAHLRSEDFFHAERYPLITFESTQVLTTMGTRTFFLVGNLSMLGVTRPIRLRVEHVGSGPDPRGGYRSGYRITGNIRRSDYGMTTMLDGLGDDIELIFGVEGVRR